MKKLLTIIAVTLAIVTLSVTQVSAVSLVTKDRPFKDVNKTWDGDKYMCWAALAANMLSTAYGVDAEETYTYFKSTRENNPYHAYYAIKDYMMAKMGKTEDQFKQTIKYYYPRDDMSMMREIMYNALSRGEVLGVTVKWAGYGKVGHALTVYGMYEDDGKWYIEYADSDDSKTELKVDRIYRSRGYWKFRTGPYKFRAFKNAIGLEIREKG